MSATFELFLDEHAHYAFRLKTPDGTVLAVSGQYPDKASAVRGIQAVRECAAMGLISDNCPPATAHPAPAYFSAGHSFNGHPSNGHPSNGTAPAFLQMQELSKVARHDRFKAAMLPR